MVQIFIHPPMVQTLQSIAIPVGALIRGSTHLLPDTITNNDISYLLTPPVLAPKENIHIKTNKQNIR